MDRVFVYGTVLFPEVVGAVIGRALRFDEAVLSGYARRRLRGRPYPGLVAAPGAVTAGRLLAGVAADGLASLDRFEGPLYERRRVRVTCRDRDGASAPAWTYVLREAHRGLVTATPWDAEDFAARCLRDYVEALRSGDGTASACRASATRRMRAPWDPSQ